MNRVDASGPMRVGLDGYTVLTGINETAANARVTASGRS